MHKSILTILLLSITNACIAADDDWFQIDSTIDAIDGGSSYINLRTLRKEGNKRKFWLLINRARKLGDYTYMSAKMQTELDCKEEKFRVLYTVWHSESMGGGESVSNNKTSEFSPIVPDSVGEGMFRFVCSDYK